MLPSYPISLLLAVSQELYIKVNNIKDPGKETLSLSNLTSIQVLKDYSTGIRGRVHCGQTHFR